MWIFSPNRPHNYGADVLEAGSTTLSPVPPSLDHNLSLYAYVIMPEHVHLLLSEPGNHNLASSLRVLKGQSSKLLKGGRDHLWQPRYYDFNVFTTSKFVEKVRYIHRNPVTRGLVSQPEDYRWSSFNHYATGEPSSIEIESEWTTNRRIPHT